MVVSLHLSCAMCCTSCVVRVSSGLSISICNFHGPVLNVFVSVRILQSERKAILVPRKEWSEVKEPPPNTSSATKSPDYLVISASNDPLRLKPTTRTQNDIFSWILCTYKQLPEQHSAEETQYGRTVPKPSRRQGGKAHKIRRRG
jgi:hypothetical protein